jgi:pyroglutamyl-peptidase
MKKLLLTAFVPFGNQEKNASLEVLKKLKKKYDDVEVEFVKLPVAFDAKIYEDLIDKHRPDFIILCGQAGGRKTIDIEKAALNYIYTNVPDNKGVIIKGSRIAYDGPDAYFSTAPVSLLCQKCEEKKLPIKLLLSAGGYVCNFSYYLMLHYGKIKELNSQIVFIHFPYFTGQVADSNPTLPLAQMVASLDYLITLILFA